MPTFSGALKLEKQHLIKFIVIRYLNVGYGTTIRLLNDLGYMVSFELLVSIVWIRPVKVNTTI